jgi:hypothetical protein
MTWIAFLVSLVISSGAVFAGVKKHPPPDYELAIQGLNLVLEGGTWCNLKPNDARHLMLPLRPAWENALKDLTQRKALPSERKKALQCKSSCTCGLWTALFEKRSGLSPSELERIKKHQRETKQEERQACLSRRVDLCKTLLPELKRIADRDYRSEGAY